MSSKVIPLFKVFMPSNAIRAMNKTLRSGYIGEGPRVKEFEAKLARWFGGRTPVAVNNGTSAIQLALRLAGVGHGDTVISTPMTCTATNTPIAVMGARILWADIDPWTGNIDPASVEKCIERCRPSDRPKAVVCVHWGGYPCDLSALYSLSINWGPKICESRGYLPIIEDCAHAFGAKYGAMKVGHPYNDGFCCFSFQAIKLLTTVDGGILITSNQEDTRRAKLLRWYGIDREQPREDFRCEADIAEWGYKFHMNDVAAAAGIAQLKHVDYNLATTRWNAKQYREAFAEMRNVSLLHYNPDWPSSYWLFTMRVKERAAFIKHMKDKGIVASRVHARNDTHSMFSEFASMLPGVDEFDAEQVSIPVGWWLDRKDVARVIKAVEQFEVQK